MRLRSGKTSCCGCSLRRKSITPAESFWNHKFGDYKKGARSRNLLFSITIETFKQLLQQDCVYCGCQPRSDYSAANLYKCHALKQGNPVNEDLYQAKILNVNGIDRLDNNIGYTDENSVTCCKTCNYMKGAMPIDEWNSWLDRLVAHRSKKSLDTAPTLSDNPDMERA
jgi:hypothetical protein